MSRRCLITYCYLRIGATLVFRASFDVPRWRVPALRTSGALVGQPRPGWATLVWGVRALYALYRVISRLAGGVDLPLGSSLVVETVFVPFLMLISDGFLLAWVLTELRHVGLVTSGQEQIGVSDPLALLPATALVCALALPARYVATMVWLVSAYVPASARAGSLGDYVRWQLGWGLTDLQALSSLAIGMAGAVAWSRGTIGSAISGYLRLLSTDGGHLVATVVIAGIGSGLVAAVPYGLVLMLPGATLGFGSSRQLRPFRHSSNWALGPGGCHRVGRAVIADCDTC